MQITTASPTTSRAPLPDGLPETTTDARTKAGSLTASRNRAAEPSPLQAKQTSDVPATSDSLTVTLSAPSSAAVVPPELPPVYAEVWKNGVKIAIIDATGGVSSANGVVAPSVGTGGAGGMLLAARRAAEIAGSVGGEIHMGGQAIDRQTLTTRTKLNLAYGLNALSL